MDTKAFDHLQNPILLVNKQGGLEYFNFVCSTFFKMSPRKLKAILKFTELVQTDNYDLVENIQKVLISGNPLVSPELSFAAGENTYTSILKFIPFEDKVLVHIQDFSIEKQLHEKYKEQILELQSTHEQIVKSEKLTSLGELIAGISHEISSPLTVAGDTLYVMSQNLQLKNYEAASKDLQELEQEFRRIKQIVANMHSMSRNKDEDLAVIDLQIVLEKSVDFIKELGILTDIELDLQLNTALILANEGKLQQVFINFLKNAVDALADSKEKKIEVRLESTEESVLVHLIDNGVGIQDADKIFDMFYSTKELGEGTGLGLTISQKIVESFHGSISIADSKVGAHFIIEFPKLELESFTSSNRYFTGEVEVEDLKFVVYAENIDYLNTVYQHFLGKPIVLILTSEKNRVSEICESYMADYVVHLLGAPLNDNCKIFNFESKSLDDYINKIEEVISGS